MKKFLHHLTPKARKEKPESQPPKSEKTQNNLALHEIYSSPNPTLTLVAIHGHGGHVTECWTDEDTSCFWLRDLLPGIFEPATQIRVLSFGYSKEDEDRIETEEIARFAIEQVTRSAGNPNGNLVWLAHSFGGPLLKGILYSDQAILERTRAVLFFGVPRNSAPWRNMALATAGEDDHVGVSEEIKKMQREVRWLGESQSRFAELCEEGRFKVWWFLETSGGVDERNRPEPEREDVIHVSKTHNEMIAYKGSEDEDWKKVEKVLIAVAGSLGQEGHAKET